MMPSFIHTKSLRWIAAILLVACALGSNVKSAFTKHDKAFYASQATVDFVRPGLVITINSAQISSAGAIGVTYTLSDPAGLPLDAAGLTTPGAISLAFVAAYIPKGQEQYVAYTTGSASGKALGAITRPDFEIGGTSTPTATAGQYTYTFIAKAPAGFDATGLRRSPSTATAISRRSTWEPATPEPPSTSFLMARRLP